MNPKILGSRSALLLSALGSAALSCLPREEEQPAMRSAGSVQPEAVRFLLSSPFTAKDTAGNEVPVMVQRTGELMVPESFSGELVLRATNWAGMLVRISVGEQAMPIAIVPEHDPAAAPRFPDPREDLNRLAVLSSPHFRDSIATPPVEYKTKPSSKRGARAAARRAPWGQR